MKWFKITLCCKILLMSMFSTPPFALSAVLTKGVPEHSIGYADASGYVLYTRTLFDIVLFEWDKTEKNYAIPMRMAFYTSLDGRKSFLMDSYWCFSLIDSYVAKENDNLIVWQMPDLNIVKFRKSRDGEYWDAMEGNAVLRVLKNGSYSISETYDDSREEHELIYGRGLLTRIIIKRNGKSNIFSVVRYSDSFVMRNEKGEEVFSVRKSLLPGSKSHLITFRSGVSEVVFKSKKNEMFAAQSQYEAELPEEMIFAQESVKFAYNSNSAVSSLTINFGVFEQCIEWNSQTGRILRDSFGSYTILPDALGKSIAVSKKTSWGNFRHEEKKINGIRRSGYNDISVVRYYMRGTSKHSGLLRKIEVFKDKKLLSEKSYIFLYDADGRVVKGMHPNGAKR